MSNVTKSNITKKKAVLLIFVFLILIAAISIIYIKFSPTTAKGDKAITITVIDNNGKSISYKENTDAKYLHQAMNELAKADDTFSFEGTTSDSGMMIETVNGITADYNKDGAYWSILVNGDYGNYGIDKQPIANHDNFTIEYTKNE